MARSRSLGLPLLAKELIEQSVRPRTYIVRSVYALLLFGFSLLIFWGGIYSRVRNPFEILGKGREMFEALMVLQTLGILLFTPALTCGAITTEKERNTFGLLLLTRLGPWTILLEKYLGRLFLMCTFLFICLPLFGFCYALGGMEQQYVWAGIYSLLVTVIQLSALGLMCSAYCRTTVAAFIATYLWGILLLFGPLLGMLVLGREFLEFPIELMWAIIDSGVQVCGRIGDLLVRSVAGLLGEVNAFSGTSHWSQLRLRREEELMSSFFVPILMVSVLNHGLTAVPAWHLLALGIPALMSAGVFLVLARVFLVRRAFAVPRQYLMHFFRGLDGLFQRLNENRFTKGIVLVNDSVSLPGDDPVAWRETTKSSLGTVRYLVRIFLALEFPVLFLCLLVMVRGSDYSARYAAISVVLAFAWTIAILLISVRSATLIAGERSHETLDVLLSTPMSCGELIRQKMMGVRRLMIVVSVPLLTATLTQGWYVWLSRGFGETLAYLFVGVSSILLLLPLVAWLCFTVSLWMKTSTRAILAALAIVVGWIVLPFPFLLSIFDAIGIRPGNPLGLMLLVSPAAVPIMSEVDELNDIARLEWVAILLNLVLYFGLLRGIKRFALSRAAQLLGRAQTKGGVLEHDGHPVALRVMRDRFRGERPDFLDS